MIGSNYRARAIRVVMGSTLITAGVLGALVLLWVGGQALVWVEISLTGALAGLLLAVTKGRRSWGWALMAISLLSLSYQVIPFERQRMGDDFFLDLSMTGSPLPSPWMGRVSESELIRVGSSLGLTPAEKEAVDQGALLLGIHRERGPQRVLDSWFFDRKWVRIIRPRGEGPFPLLRFLHGHGGLFEVYSQMLRGLAKEHGILVALPSEGFGFWMNQDSQEYIDETVRFVNRRFPVKQDAMILAGLSAGAMGALKRLAEDPFPFRACVAISGVPPEEFPITPLDGAKVIFVYGTEDERIEARQVRKVMEAMAQRGAEVEDKPFDATHFLMLTHREPVIQIIREAYH